MRWLLLCMCVCAVAGIELLCDPPLCSVETPDYRSRLKFYVEGNTVEINHTVSYLYVNCHRRSTLDSLAMPHFTSEFKVSTIILAECPLPTTRNASLANALSAMNVTLQPINGETFFKLFDFPPEPKLTPYHFSGLEHLTNLSIKSFVSNPELPTSFFGEFHNLRSLQLRGFQLSDGELSRLPQTLKSLDLTGISAEILPETLQAAVFEATQALPGLERLTLEKRYSESTFNVNETTDKIITKLQNNATSSLESIDLYFWTELRPAPLDQCDNLRVFASSKSLITGLPARFVAACPRIEVLRVNVSPGLKSLPVKFLEGANTLKRLELNNCNLKSLPEGFFQYAPNLIELDLSYNSLETLPSDIFLGVPLQSLLVHHNYLNSSLLSSLTELTTLTELNLARNDFGDFCEDNGYSPLQNLTKLKKLDLSYNDITRICRDWRENLLYLEVLNLNSDKIRRLRFTDFQYTRDTSVKNSVVNLGDWFTFITFTENDYKNALTAPKTDVTLKFENNFVYDDTMNLECDCSVYWLRRAMTDASHAIKIKNLHCKDKRNLKDLKPEEVCPGREIIKTTEKS